MKRKALLNLSVVVAMFLLLLPGQVWAQSGSTTSDPTALVLATDYPDIVVGQGDSISIPLTLQTGSEPQIVELELLNLPEGWTATFKGGSKVIQSAYVLPDKDTKVTLKLEPPATVNPDTYRFTVVARGEGTTQRLPVSVTIQEKVPPSLSFTTDLPVIQGSANTTFRFSTRLKNEGDEDVDVNLIAQAPDGFLIKFKVSGKEVTSIPLEANRTKTVSVEAKAFMEVPAGDYPIKVMAQGDNVEASLDLAARVTGQPELTISAPDGRLSAKAEAGKETSLSLVVYNKGTAAAHAIKMSSTQPQGWTIEFDPDQIPQLEPGQQTEVTAKLRPADKAIAGDYMVQIKARPEESVTTEQVDFRITVNTSTLWGVIGIGLIAVAVAVVAIAVARFGRR
ncbi:MAG: hypothetical protein D6775_13325 [Caldilineae bacterium]|nr:MAG: hypothetical protein D6775_13325 [Caldilineae bacterium]